MFILSDPCESCSVPGDLIWACEACMKCRYCELDWFSEDVLEKDQMSFFEFELNALVHERKELFE